MVRAIAFGKLQKTWDVIWGDATVFHLTSVHHVQLYIFMFMHKISIRVACVNGELAVILPAGAELTNVCVGSEGEVLSEEEAGIYGQLYY